jgi:hypothetical protein
MKAITSSEARPNLASTVDRACDDAAAAALPRGG